MRRPLLPAFRGGVCFAAALTALVIVALSAAIFARSATQRSFAASSVSPPPPPTYVPTPIGSPPGPPTATPTRTPQGPTATVTLTSSATASAGRSLDFTLDAVRLSKAHNPGNLGGLIAVTPGTKTWLMMYFTLKSVPKNMSEIRTYAIEYRGRILFERVYKDSVVQGTVGRFARYIPYKVPQDLPYGKYLYKATLALGKRSKSKAWKFAVAQQEQQATSG